ncbi:MAG: ABC transporter substrate-binding protein [Alphaproteobacteria bacterium]|nr:ABC transporter substrate-binding protein [Alphaproteobacteria bacterium]
MVKTTVTRRTVLRVAALATTTVATPLVRGARAAGNVVPSGKMVLAWHTNIASRWLDPQQHDGTASPDNFIMALHDALIKNLRERRYDDPALSESYAMAEDAKSATFRLRPGLKFHDRSPVTLDDVKWSFEHYRGAWSEVLHDKTDGVEIVDDHSVRFHFREPFLDFPILLGTANVSGGGWVVPAKYYEQVGQSGFMQKPIGAGPYKLVSQEPGVRLEFEAFEDYYRPVLTKQLTMVSVPEAATRIAMLERGEADIIYNVPGELIDRVKSNPKLMLAPIVSANFWLEFPGFQDAKSPFHDQRVRQAISLAIDRDAINQAECDGLGRVDGNWINDDVEYGLSWPTWEHNVPKAKQLMAEAGFPNGFAVDWLTPVPNYYSRGERIVSQLQAIGIRAKLQTIERGVFLKRLQGGLKEWPGVQIIMNAARVGGTWSNWYDSFMKCGGFNGRDRNCVQELDAKFSQYLGSVDPSERKRLATEVQGEILENYYFVPVFRHAAMQAIGPRVAAAKWQDVFPTITTAYAYPWEDIQLKS